MADSRCEPRTIGLQSHLLNKHGPYCSPSLLYHIYRWRQCRVRPSNLVWSSYCTNKTLRSEMIYPVNPWWCQPRGHTHYVLSRGMVLRMVMSMPSHQSSLTRPPRTRRPLNVLFYYSEYSCECRVLYSHAFQTELEHVSESCRDLMKVQILI